MNKLNNNGINKEIQNLNIDTLRQIKGHKSRHKSNCKQIDEDN